MSTKLRYYEYYNLQSTFDWLYQRSTINRMDGINLYKIIISDANTLLAYRVIKKNKGSVTAGIDKQTIYDYDIKNKEQFIQETREILNNFSPQEVKRVYIPKSNGKSRPLGIPTMRDRLIQQMFKQVLEPICEAKFYKHSYGFRSNRSAHHALARCQFLINKANCHYVVDIDIKGFFDNVNHTRLLKQLYNIGIKDKRVLMVIGKMLKSPVYKIGIQEKGTPQGAILSPLLSNIVLNDLDMWIAKQWEIFPSKVNYTMRNKYRALKTTQLKEMFIVRYADDFKIFTKTHEAAWKTFHAVKGYLKNNLKLDISPEKSKVTNLRKQKSEFLGFEIKAVLKKKKYVAQSHVSEKNRKAIQETVKRRLKKIQKRPTWQNVNEYNSYILGIHGYFGIATHVNKDFSAIAYSLMYTQYNRLSSVSKYGIPRSPPAIYRKFYKTNWRTYKVAKIYLFPLGDINWRLNRNFNQRICDYTEIGRRTLYKKLNDSVYKEIQELQSNTSNEVDLNYADNRISKYSMQKGKCIVTGLFLHAREVNCHHIVPKYLGGTDDFKNLVIMHKWIHKLIHATTSQTIERYSRPFKLTGKQLGKINKYREKCNLISIC